MGHGDAKSVFDPEHCQSKKQSKKPICARLFATAMLATAFCKQFLIIACFTFSYLRFHANIPSSCLDDADFVMMMMIHRCSLFFLRYTMAMLGSHRSYHGAPLLFCPSQHTAISYAGQSSWGRRNLTSPPTASNSKHFLLISKIASFLVFEGHNAPL